MYTVLAEELEKLRQKVGAETLTEVTKDMHLYPDLHGKSNYLNPCFDYMLRLYLLARKPITHSRPYNERLNHGTDTR